MKRLLVLLVFMTTVLCPNNGLSQATTGLARQSQVLSRANGSVSAQIVPYATVVVTNTASPSTPATIYSDPLLTSRITPAVVTADSSGNYSYYIPLNYCVTETITSPGQGSKTIPNICGNTAGTGGNVSNQVISTIPLNTNGVSTAINASSGITQTGSGTGQLDTFPGTVAPNAITPTNPVAVPYGGTGATTANGAMTNLGITQSGSGAGQLDTFPGTVAAPTVVLTYPSGTPSAIPASTADDSVLSGLNSRRLTTFTLDSFNQTNPYSTGHLAGDSIMFGLSSGGSNTANCALPFTSSTACFGALVTQALGIPGNDVTMEAVAGDATPDLLYREFNSYSGPADNQFSMVQIGTNDMQGEQRNSSPVTLAIEPDLIQQWMAYEEYYSIDPANWYEATGSTCSGGSWTADTYYGTHPGCQSHTNGDVLTFPAWQSVTGGEPVTVLYRAFNPAVANGATFFVKIGVGSSSSGPFTPTASATFNTVSTAAPLNFINITGGNATSTIFPAVLSNSTNVLGPGTGVSNSAFSPVVGSWYQVTVIIISATSSSNNLSILGMGTGMGYECATCNINPATWPSQFYRLSIPATKGGYQWGIWYQLNSDWDSATLLDQQSGFSVNKLDTSTCLTGNPVDYDPDNIHHPLASGHAKIAQCVLFGQPSKSVPPSTSASAAPLNASGGTIVGTVALGTTNSAMQFNDQTGELVFAPRSGNVTTGSLLTFDGRSAPTFPPTSANTTALPGIAGTGHWLDQIVAWYDSGSTNVYAQAWRDIYGSNTSATVTPTAFTRTFNCTPTAVTGYTTVGACLPYVWTFNFPTTVAGVSSAVNWNSARHTFTGNSVISGLGVGCISTDPSTLVNGDIWCNSTSNRLKTYLNGVTQTVASLSDLASPHGLISGYCASTATSSATIYLWGLGSITSTCTGTGSAGVAFIMGGSGTLSNLSVRCATTGVSSSSGVFTVQDAPSGTASLSGSATGLTVTYGTTTANTAIQDTTHTHSYAAGDAITIKFTTQGSETLAGCSASVNF